MISSLYLMQLRPDLTRLLPWAERARLLPATGQSDLGYAFHAALAGAFGDHAPKPYSYSKLNGLLAYTSRDPEELRSAACLAMPELADLLGLNPGPRSPGLLMRPFPTAWRPGQRLGFEVRVRPILRTAAGQERDVFLAAVEQRPGVNHDRAAVYREWLDRQLEGAAHLEDAEVSRFRLSAVLRQGAPGAEGNRKRRSITGPDVVFSGHLRVQDSGAFTQKVARGIGRHRAFGFGMLLLKPAAGLRP